MLKKSVNNLEEALGFCEKNQGLHLTLNALSELSENFLIYRLWGLSAASSVFSHSHSYYYYYKIKLKINNERTKHEILC